MKSYLLFPFGNQDLNNKIFESPYRLLRQILAERGVNLQTFDRGELNRADKVLFFNHQPSAYQSCRKAGLRTDQMVLFLLEPRVVIPQQYQPTTWQLYGTVFTFLDDLVQNQGFKKMFYPQGLGPFESVPGWKDRKFLTLINANKYSYVPHELYSLRRLAIKHFEHRTDFDLYGLNWDKNEALRLGVASQALQQGRWLSFLRDVVTGWRHFVNYRGTVNDKFSTLKHYKFCLAFENEEKTAGYITEKLFDCLLNGTIPVYLGADNVTDYIPAECFIDFRKFSGFAELEMFLMSMSEFEFQRYQRNGQHFLHSPAFAPWLPKNAFTAFVQYL